MAGEIRQATILIRDRQVSGGAIPSSALMAEPFVNIYDGILKFSGVTGGSFEPSSTSSIFEVGSKLYNSKITNRLSVNGNFVVSGDTGTISTYSGITGSGLIGKFLSGTTNGFVLGNISDIQGVTTYVQSGVNIITGGTSALPTVNLVASPSVNNFTFSGTATGGNLLSTNISATTGFFSAGTSLETIIYNIATSTENITLVQPGSNITTGGTASSPIVSVSSSPSFNGISFSGTAIGGSLAASNISASTLTSGRVVYVGASGKLIDEAGFEYNESTNLLKTGKLQIGNFGDTGTTTTIYGDILVVGSAISGFTSELYIEDNLIELNYNPTGSTTSTSLGAGFSIQDGSGVAGTDVFWDIRGTGTTVENRSFTTNLSNIILSESGTTSSPNGVYVLKSYDILDGGFY